MHFLRLILALLLALLIPSTSVATEIKNFELRKTAKGYFDTYSARQNFDGFLNFYHPKIELKDMVGGYHIVGKRELKQFFNWNSPKFKLIDAKAMMLEQLIVDPPNVAAKGYFTPFIWNGLRFNAMHFTTMLTFSAGGKIVEQVDWINYPPSLLDYEKRHDSNSWIQTAEYKQTENN